MGLKMKNAKYRKEDDILYINLDKKVQESVPRGGFVIDLSPKGKIAGVEIIGASQALSELLDEEPETIQAILENMEEADIIVKEVSGVAFMILRITSTQNGETQETKVPLEIPQPTKA